MNLKNKKVLILLLVVLFFTTGCPIVPKIEYDVGNQYLAVGDTTTMYVKFSDEIQSYKMVPYINNKEVSGPYLCNETYGMESVIVSANNYNDTYQYKFYIYTDKNCKKDEIISTSPMFIVDKNKVIPDVRCKNSITSGEYCKVTDNSYGEYKKIGQQGHSSDYCLCFSAGYAKMMINNTKITTRTTKCLSYLETYYSDNNGELFEEIKTQILQNDRPVIVRVNNASGSQHYILINGILRESTRKGKTELSYSDFWAVDPVGESKIASTSYPPTEKNWKELIDSQTANKGNNRKIKGNEYRLIK